jgi:hypothetical protein
VIVALEIFSVASFSHGVAAVAAPRSTRAMLVIMMILPPDEIDELFGPLVMNSSPAGLKLSHIAGGVSMHSLPHLQRLYGE